MHMFRSNFGRCQSLWQVTNVVGKRAWYQPLSVSSVNADIVEKDEDAFGLLSSNPSSEFYEKGRRKRFDDHDPKHLKSSNKEQPEHEEEKALSSAASKVSKSFQQERALEKWRTLKNTNAEKIVRLSRNLVQDDDEDEYLRYFTSDLDFRKKHFNKRNIVSEGIHKSDKSFNNLLPTEYTVNDEESFGNLSPSKNLHEYEEGDEGDEIQRKYEEAVQQRRHTPAYYGFRIKALCKERKLLDALRILEEEMPAVAVKPNSFCYQILINACGRAGYTKKAFQLYNKMKKRGLKVHAVAYTGLFNACAHSPWLTTDGLSRAHKLREQLKEKGYIFNQTISHAMIKAFGRCGDITTAFHIVDEMLEQGLLVTTETINFMLQACITDQETGFRYALLVWRKMRELRLLPDIYTYNLLIQCVRTSKAGDPTLTSQLLVAGFKPNKKKTGATRNKEEKETIKEKDFKVVHLNSINLEKDNVETQRNGLENYSESTTQNEIAHLEVIDPNSRLEKLRKVSSSAGELEVLPNLLARRLTRGCAIGLSSLDQPEDRLALLCGPPGIFENMARDKVTPNLRTVTQMLESLPSTIEAETSLLQSMKNIGLTPDTQFFNMLIRKRNFRHDFDSAKAVLDLMQEHRLLPDLITFGCLALGCTTLRKATELLSDMNAIGFRPNLEIMTTLIKQGIRKQNYFYALEMLREMHKQNITPNEDLLSYLEEARIKAREIILKMETGKFTDTTDKQKEVENAKLFLLEYKHWLKKSKVQLNDHPWAQYRWTTPETGEEGR